MIHSARLSDRPLTWAGAAAAFALAVGLAWVGFVPAGQAGGPAPLPPPMSGFGMFPPETGGRDLTSLKADRSPKIGEAPGVVMVAYWPQATAADRAAVTGLLGLEEDTSRPSPYFVRYFISPAALASGATVESTIAALRRLPSVRLAEPDRAVLPEQAPDDPRFGEQYGLHNTGQLGGVVGADCQALPGWAAATTTTRTLVAVLDDGVAIDHPDLAQNVFVNPGEIPANGTDDDGNGFIDDVSGWDFADNDNDPRPGGTNAHGTHVAGIVGMRWGNAVGGAGGARFVRILPVRFFRGQSTWMSDLIRGLDYSRQMGARVTTTSYNIDGYTTFLVEAIGRLKAADIVYVNSAGNGAQDMDSLRGQIALVHDNVLFVAALDRRDQLASFSNWGQTCALATAGVDVLSTLPGNTYGTQSGTSMAAPLGAAGVAMLRAEFPSVTAGQAIARISGTSVPVPALAGRTSGGRMSLFLMLDPDNTPPAPPGTPTLVRRSATVLDIQFTATGDDGTTGAASAYDVRWSTAPITPANFGAATRISNPVPTANAGDPIRVQVNGLFPGSDHYIAVRARDNVGNDSPVVASGPFRTARAIFADRMQGPATFTAVSGPWALSGESVNSPSLAWSDSPGAQYANSADWVLRANSTFPVTGPSSLRVYIRTDLEARFDFLNLDTSVDNGATWQTRLRLTGTAGWRSYTVPLLGMDGQNVLVRFRMTSDSSVVRDGVWIDDLHLVRLRSTLLDDFEGPGQFTGDAPWARTTERATSPVHAWSDSPGGQYANNVSLWLRRNAPVDASGLADPSLAFAMSMSLENNYDFLEVRSSTDAWATSTMGTRLTGAATGWATYVGPIAPAGNLRIGFRLTTDGSVTADGVYIDDVSLIGEPWVRTVTGVLDLDGYTGALSDRPIVLAVTDPATGAVLESAPLELTPAGTGRANYTGEFSQPGEVNLRFTGPQYLHRLVRGVDGSDVTRNVALANGDVNGDNVVDGLDLAILDVAWGSTPGGPAWNPVADLNGDRVVDGSDLAVMIARFNQEGD